MNGINGYTTALGSTVGLADRYDKPVNFVPVDAFYQPDGKSCVQTGYIVPKQAPNMFVHKWNYIK